MYGRIYWIFFFFNYHGTILAYSTAIRVSISLYSKKSQMKELYKNKSNKALNLSNSIQVMTIFPHINISHIIKPLQYVIKTTSEETKYDEENDETKPENPCQRQMFKNFKQFDVGCKFLKYSIHMLVTLQNKNTFYEGNMLFYSAQSQIKDSFNADATNFEKKIQR